MFSRIYIEEEIKDHEVTKHILSRLCPLPIVQIKQFSEIFHRKRQSFRIQKKSPALILAKKRGTLIFQGKKRINSFGAQPVYYNDMVRNCVYDCSYCFLQGMHHSANILIYVNIEDYIRKAKEIKNPGILSISYFSDILAFENLFPFIRRTAKGLIHTKLNIEIRTKSDATDPLLTREVMENVIINFSLSPPAISRQYEHGCASSGRRLFAAKQLLDHGYRIAFSFDPIILSPTWKKEYEAYFKHLFSIIEGKKIENISYGFFRLHEGFGKTFQGASTFESSSLTPHKGILSLNPENLKDGEAEIRRLLSPYIDPGKINFVHG